MLLPAFSPFPTMFSEPLFCHVVVLKTRLLSQGFKGIVCKYMFDLG